MRKVVYAVGISLDGYIAAADGSVEWLDRATAKAKGEDFGMTKFFRSVDTVLMGRKTYEVAVQMGMKEGYPKMRNLVFSRTEKPGKRNGVEFVSRPPEQVIAELKKRPGRHIWLCGGGELARAALSAGSVDRVELGVVPMAIGGGRPAFPPGFPEVELKLGACKQYKGGVVGLTYDVVKKKRSRRG